MLQTFGALTSLTPLTLFTHPSLDWRIFVAVSGVLTSPKSKNQNQHRAIGKTETGTGTGTETGTGTGTETGTGTGTETETETGTETGTGTETETGTGTGTGTETETETGTETETETGTGTRTRSSHNPVSSQTWSRTPQLWSRQRKEFQDFLSSTLELKENVMRWAWPSTTELSLKAF
ncbi:protein PAXX isoform X2 [Eucyclogobius newberryi]|uniref:protein PAXX isoform X2 n=1 Tax=Eucyclogobius newberryi TaxID=166745 RepID=UPI003B5A78F2